MFVCTQLTNLHTVCFVCLLLLLLLITHISDRQSRICTPSLSVATSTSPSMAEKVPRNARSASYDALVLWWIPPFSVERRNGGEAAERLSIVGGCDLCQ